MLYVNARFLTQPLTGVQRYGIEISLQLKELYGERIKFVAPANIIHTDIARKLNVEIVGKRSGHLWEQIDLLLFLKRYGNPLLLCLGNTAPVCYHNKIVTIHDITFIRYPDTFSTKFRWFYRTIIPLIIKTSRQIFTVSEFSKDEITQYYKLDRDRCSVAYNAVSSFFFQKKVEIPREEFFLTVSSVKENKNTLLPLSVFKKLYQQGESLSLYVIGDLKSSSFHSFDLSEYTHVPTIKFVGRVSDEELRDYYNRAKAFIFPSFYEGFGIPPLEAQSCGCPVLSSNMSCLPEVLGDSVLYFDPLSNKDLEDKLHALQEDEQLRRRCVEAGFRNCSRFSWKKSALGYKSFIDSIL